MDLLICIEGAKANTESNIFEELIMQTNNRFERCLRFVSIDALNKKRQATVSKNLINAINIKYDIATNEFDKFKNVYIIHDGDVTKQKGALAETTKTIKNYFKSIVSNINFENIKFNYPFGNSKNNIENEFLCKLLEKQVSIREFEEITKIKIKNFKNKSFKDPLNRIKEKIKINIYQKQGLIQLFTNLCANKSAYCFVFENLLKK